MKPKLVILEGADKVGKSTTHKLLAHETNHKVMIIDRFIGSYIAYGEMNGTKTPEEIRDMYNLEDKLQESFDILLVYLHAPVEELLIRSKRHNELEKESFYINHIATYYKKYLRMTSFNHVEIDTGVFSPKGCVDRITEVLNMLEWDRK